MPKIFVIGSNSFAGASYIRHALLRGNQVIGVSRSAPADLAYLPYKWESNYTVPFYQIDLNHDYVALQLLLEREQPDYIINFAAQSMVAQSWGNPADWMETNIVATTRLMETLRSLTCLKKYIHFSTPEVYGHTPDWIQEDHPFSPSTPYALSRAAGDQVVALWQKTYDIPVAITRAANIYGEGQTIYRIIPRTILSCLTGEKFELHGGGVSERSFIHMDDVSNALELILQEEYDTDVGLNSYHISTSEAISIRSLVEIICAQMDLSLEGVAEVGEELLGKDMCYLLDCAQIHSQLGWEPTISLQNGLERCIEWVHTYQDRLMALPKHYIHKR